MNIVKFLLKFIYESKSQTNLTANQFHIMLAIVDGNKTLAAISSAICMQRHQASAYLKQMHSDGWLCRPQKDSWELSYNGQFELTKLLKAIKIDT